MKEHIYLAVDLKSFYASVECIERNLDPLTTNLVVADKSRTEKRKNGNYFKRKMQKVVCWRSDI